MPWEATLTLISASQPTTMRVGKSTPASDTRRGGGFGTNGFSSSKVYTGTLLVLPAEVVAKLTGWMSPAFGFLSASPAAPVVSNPSVSMSTAASGWPRKRSCVCARAPARLDAPPLKWMPANPCGCSVTPWSKPKTRTSKSLRASRMAG